MRWKRWIGITAEVIVTLILIVTVILLFFDYNMLKPYIVQAVEQSTGRQLALRGDIFGLISA